MSKTFSNEGRDLTIEKSDFGGVKFRVESNGEHANGAVAPVADAPAIALAILEAAYPPADYLLDGSPESFLAVAASYLRKASLAAESKAKEAADREALEAEAWELFKACHPETTGTSLEPGFTSYDIWTSVARKAREIHGATK